jgi:hypothetical protein
VTRLRQSNSLLSSRRSLGSSLSSSSRTTKQLRIASSVVTQPLSSLSVSSFAGASRRSLSTTVEHDYPKYDNRSIQAPHINQALLSHTKEEHPLESFNITWEQWGNPELGGEKTILLLPSFSHGSHAKSNEADTSPGTFKGDRDSKEKNVKINVLTRQQVN